MTEFINAITPESWAMLGGLVGTGTLVSVIVQVIKHFGKLKEAKKFVLFLLSAFSVLGSLAGDVITHSTLSPVAFTGKYAGWILAIAVVMHRIAVSPVFKKFVVFLNDLASVRDYRKTQVQAATVAQEFTLTA